MFYLYLKTHNVTGLSYLGYTKKVPQKYKGSGKYWMRHIKKHGNDVTTVVLYETHYKEEITEQGVYFSDLWNIVESKDFANLKREEGSGGKIIFTDEIKKKIGKSNRGKKRTEETKIKLSKSRYKYLQSQTEEDKEIFSKKVSESRIGKRRGPLPQEWRNKIRDSMIGKNTGKRKDISTCPHCNKTGWKWNMYRWHFDNCKLKGITNVH